MQLEESLPAAKLAYSLRRVYGVHGNYGHPNPKEAFRFIIRVAKQLLLGRRQSLGVAFEEFEIVAKRESPFAAPQQYTI